MSKRTQIQVSPPEAVLIDAKLEALDLQTLLAICVGLLTICAQRSAEIDPAVAAMVAYAREEVLEQVNNESSLEINWPASTAQTTLGRIKPTHN
jgi:hypothetical protein